MSRKQNKGFTLAELLIVVAIIAVLVAIGIPVFARQRLKAQEAVDKANLRSAYAQVMAAAASDPDHSWYVPVKMTHQGKGNHGNVHRQFALASEDETIGGGIRTMGINRPEGDSRTLYVVLYTPKALSHMHGHSLWNDNYGYYLNREYGITNSEDTEYIDHPRIVIAMGTASGIYASDLKKAD